MIDWYYMLFCRYYWSPDVERTLMWEDLDDYCEVTDEC